MPWGRAGVPGSPPTARRACGGKRADPQRHKRGKAPMVGQLVNLAVLRRHIDVRARLRALQGLSCSQRGRPLLPTLGHARHAPGGGRARFPGAATTSP
eukprot:9002594-Alexandrium_andersonii.AAC.1